MQWQTKISKEDELIALAKGLVINLFTPALIFLQGNLGAGKTAFARACLREMGYEGPVKSPTYTLVETYPLKQKTIHHFDFYRLKSAEELEQLGLEDYFTNDAICFIEWPEQVGPLKLEPTLSIQIDILPEGRILSFIAKTEAGNRLIQAIKRFKR